MLPDDVESLLEIGAGQGAAGSLLARKLRYVGIEPDRESFEVAERRLDGLGSMFNTTAQAFWSEEPFDVVCAFEVIEHIEDDQGAMNSWLKHLRPGGWLLISVPAGAHRFGPQDVRVGHFRRYDRSDLVGLLERAGLADVTVMAYGFPLGYVLEKGRDVLARVQPGRGSQAKRSGESGRWLQPPDWVARLTQGLSAPFRYAQRPFSRTSLGTGYVARARKPGG